MKSSSTYTAKGFSTAHWEFGSGYPTWDTNATGMFLGLRSTTNKADMARAVMEGVGYNFDIIYIGGIYMNIRAVYAFAYGREQEIAHQVEVAYHNKYK